MRVLAWATFSYAYYIFLVVECKCLWRAGEFIFDWRSRRIDITYFSPSEFRRMSEFQVSNRHGPQSSLRCWTHVYELPSQPLVVIDKALFSMQLLVLRPLDYEFESLGVTGVVASSHGISQAASHIPTKTNWITDNIRHCLPRILLWVHSSLPHSLATTQSGTFLT